MSPAASAKQLCARSRPAEASARRLRWRLKPPEAGESPLGVGGAAGVSERAGRGGAGRGWGGARRAPRPAACTWPKLRTKQGLLGTARTVSPPLRPGPATCTRGRTRSDSRRARTPGSWGRRGGDEGGGRGAGPRRPGAARGVWPLRGRAGLSRSRWHRTRLSPSQESGLRGPLHSGLTTVKSQGRTGRGGRVEAGEAASPAGAAARAALPTAPLRTASSGLSRGSPTHGRGRTRRVPRSHGLGQLWPAHCS